MRIDRKLTLRREALTPLTSDELHHLAAGEAITGGRGCRIVAIGTAVLLIATPHITNINCFADEA